MSPALIQLLILLAQQVPTVVAVVQAMIAQKGNPTLADFEALATQFQTDLAAANAAIAAAQKPQA